MKRKLTKLQKKRIEEIDEYMKTPKAKKYIDESFELHHGGPHSLSVGKRDICSDCYRTLPCQCLIGAEV